MKTIYFSLLICVFMSCSFEKTIVLPEINHSEITEILDVSAAYIFYDESKPDSLELNRKNLISTTNWLVNVDKRLTLEQVMPSIIFLQDKKRNAEIHKNEAAKNYFTCNYTTIKNLGFIEFTDVYYHTDASAKVFKNEVPLNTTIISFLKDEIQVQNKKITFSDLKSMDSIDSNFILKFHEKITFQDYISYKSKLIQLKLNNASINKNEFIY